MKRKVYLSSSLNVSLLVYQYPSCFLMYVCCNCCQHYISFPKHLKLINFNLVSAKRLLRTAENNFQIDKDEAIVFCRVVKGYKTHDDDICLTKRGQLKKLFRILKIPLSLLNQRKMQDKTATRDSIGCRGVQCALEQIGLEQIKVTWCHIAQQLNENV